jgi:hypothetical protein
MERTLAQHREQWKNNLSLLQTYRQIFTGSQAVFLAVGAFLAEGKTGWLVLTVAGVSFVIIWWIWFQVVRDQCLVVDFHQLHLEYLEDHYQLPEIVCSETRYVEDPAARRKTNRALGIQTNWRSARVKMDVLLPALYSLTWLLLVLYGMTP